MIQDHHSLSLRSNQILDDVRDVRLEKNVNHGRNRIVLRHTKEKELQVVGNKIHPYKKKTCTSPYTNTLRVTTASRVEPTVGHNRDGTWRWTSIYR